MRQLGVNGPQVFPVALGCMGMSDVYGPADENESVATIHEALDQGVNLLDTGDFYGSGHNEMLIGHVLRDRRDRPMLSVKFGAMRAPDGGWSGFDSRPAAVKNFLTYSLRRLKVDYIDIYRPARLDPQVPIEETIGAISEMVKAGYVRYIGLSEVGVDTIRRAHAVHPICDLQIEYAIVSRSPEEKIFPVLEELGIGVTAYGVLSRGLLSGSKPASPKDMRNHLPRFTGDNLANNRKLVETLNQIAAERGVTVVQLAFAWVLAKGDSIVPLIGARTRKQLADAMEARAVKLTAEELTRIEEAVPATAIAGTRYAEMQMRMLDSER